MTAQEYIHDAHWERKNIPECCGMPVIIFELSGKGRGDWVCHCKICWEGTMPQNSRDAAIEAWERECEGGDLSGKA